MIVSGGVLGRMSKSFSVRQTFIVKNMWRSKLAGESYAKVGKHNESFLGNVKEGSFC